MKRIVIIGNSPAGIKAIEEIRAVDQESSVTLIDQEGTLPYIRSRFPDWLAGAVKEKECLFQEESFYKKLNIEIIKDKSVVRITAKRNKIVLENKKEERGDLIYDKLIITDAVTKLPEVKGDQRSGAFGLRRFADAQAISKMLPLVDTVVVQSETFWGLETILALRKKDKEVLWCIPSQHLFPDLIDASTAAVLKQNLEAEGIRIFSDNAVVEILGDQEVKAVRLKSGKVLAADMVLFPDSGPDLKIYSDGGLSVAFRITVNSNFQTSAENVFAMDDVCDAQGEWSIAALEDAGKAAAAKITGQESTLAAPSNQDSALSKIEQRMSEPGEAVSAPESQSQPA